jgi:hypothetical protein
VGLHLNRSDPWSPGDIVEKNATAKKRLIEESILRHIIGNLAFFPPHGAGILVDKTMFFF